MSMFNDIYELENDDNYFLEIKDLTDIINNQIVRKTVWLFRHKSNPHNKKVFIHCVKSNLRLHK